MIINPNLEKLILQRLKGEYPNPIYELKDVLPEHDPDEVCKHLFYFRDNGWVKFKEVRSRDGIGCITITITKQGINHLETLA